VVVLFRDLYLYNNKIQGGCVVHRPVFKGGHGWEIAPSGNIKIKFRGGKILKW